MRLLDDILWAIDRPQQGLFQGSKAGSKAFGDSLREGSNPLYAALASVPQFAEGAYQGLTGQGKDVHGRDLTEGMTDGGEWGNAHEEALGNVLDLIAAPIDAWAPGGKAAGTVLHNKNMLRKAAPEVAERWKQLGNPLTNIPEIARRWADRIGEGLDGLTSQGLRPVAAVAEVAPEVEKRKGLVAGINAAIDHVNDTFGEALGNLNPNIWIANAPKHIDDIDPLVIKSGGKTVPGWVQDHLYPHFGENQESLRGLFHNNRRHISRNTPGNEITVGHQSPGTLTHEMTHYLDDLLNRELQPSINSTRAQVDFMGLMKSKGAADRRYHGPEDAPLYWQKAVNMLTKALPEEQKRLAKYYKPHQIPRELMPRAVAKQLMVPSEAFPRTGTSPYDDATVEAVRELAGEGWGYLPKAAWGGPPPALPTQAASQMRRAAEKELKENLYLDELFKGL